MSHYLNVEISAILRTKDPKLGMQLSMVNTKTSLGFMFNFFLAAGDT